MLQPDEPLKRMETKVIKVDLLLRGGLQHSVNLCSSDPMLRKIFQILINRGHGKVDFPLGVLQVPLDAGRASLYIPASEVVGVITEPPMNLSFPEVDDAPAKLDLSHLSDISIEQKTPKQEQRAIQSGLDRAIALSSPQPVVQFVAPKSSVFPLGHPTGVVRLPPHYLQIDQFLSVSDYERVLNIALSREAQFIGSGTTTNANDYRHSSILYATYYEEFYHFFRKKLMQVMPSAIQALNLPIFDVAEVEMQMTAHNDGCFYKIHNDSGDAPTATRILTYVYYFYQEPKAFSGGELRLYDTELEGTRQTALSDFEDIEPRNNSVLFFDSRCMHEVRPVECPSRQFAHGRFTLNGWLRCSNEVIATTSSKSNNA